MLRHCFNECCFEFRRGIDDGGIIANGFVASLVCQRNRIIGFGKIGGRKRELQIVPCVKACPFYDIGILNAKGKSKEALELLRQWSKEGEYFSSKIKEVTGHIDGLNAEVNKWQSKYNSERRMVEQMSDYNKAANSTIEEQEYEIGRLIRQNDHYRELLDRIPDEIYEEITNTRSKNRDRGER